MKTRTAETSPLVRARVAGLLYLIANLFAPFTLIYLPSRLVVPGDAAGTDRNMASLMVIFSLAAVPIAMLNELNDLAVLQLLSGAGYLNVFTTGQLQAL